MHSVHCPKVIGFGWTGHDEKGCWNWKEVEKKGEDEVEKDEQEGSQFSSSHTTISPCAKV